MIITFVEPIVCNMWGFNQDHLAEPHSQVPWDEEEYEELPWHMVPDLNKHDPNPPLFQGKANAKATWWLPCWG